MTYITDKEIAALPENSEEKFILLERIVRARYEEKLIKLGDNESPLPLQRSYMSIVLPAARFCGITPLTNWQRPETDRDDWRFYENFIAEVDYCITELRLRNAERTKENSVTLTASEKSKLQHLLRNIRETVEKLEVSVAKKERLYSRINALQAEIDLERTRYQAFGALMIEACTDVGEAAKCLEPLVRQIERVGAALGIAKRQEEAQPRLQSKDEPKRIEPPENPLTAPKKAKNGIDKALGGDIPF